MITYPKGARVTTIHVMKAKIMDLAEYVPGGKKWPGWLLNIGERILGFHIFNTAHSMVEEELEAGSTENFFRYGCRQDTGA